MRGLLPQISFDRTISVPISTTVDMIFSSTAFIGS
jgi:hypothetical protein